MITFTTELPTNLDILTKFEEQHPKELRWGFDLKLETYYDENSHYIWLLKDGEIAGEIILGWLHLYLYNTMHRADYVDVNSFTILPEFRSQGLGKQLLAEALRYCRENNFNEVIASCRQGASVRTFLSFGAIITNVNKNWAGCGEDYVEVKIQLQ